MEGQGWLEEKTDDKLEEKKVVIVCGKNAWRIDGWRSGRRAGWSSKDGLDMKQASWDANEM